MEAVRAAVEEFSTKRGNFDRVREHLNRAERVGRNDSMPGIALGAAAFDEIDKLRYLNRLPTGVLELDSVLDGGPPRGSLGVAMAGPGGGKSMMLNHITGNALWLGQHACVATLELPERLWLARLAANITNFPIDKVLDGSMEAARSRLVELAPQLGPCTVKYFTPKATTVEDIKRWVLDVEQHVGSPVSLLVVDYADKLIPSHRVDARESEYKAMDRVYESLRIFAEESSRWAWTASQAKRGDKRRKVIEVDDVADSMGKVRVCDLALSLMMSDQQEQVSFYVAKNRVGRALIKVGPLPTDLANGRIVPPSMDGAESSPF
jgi:replicative DNA helicase